MDSEAMSSGIDPLIGLDRSGERVDPKTPTLAWGSRIRIVIPFYKNAELVQTVVGSLLACSEELIELGASVHLVNDSPGFEPLSSALLEYPKKNTPFIIRVIENKNNQGFVRTVNSEMLEAIATKEDIILLNSDTIVFPGAIREMTALARSDPMIAFVSPRSNNATIASFPAGFQNASPGLSAARFAQLSRFLRASTYVPTAVGFCLYIKWRVLADIGVFDECYGDGYNEENDLIMRAGRLGYRAALANHAFVWHQGERSFGSTNVPRATRESTNRRILLERYPEYAAITDQYLKSPEYRSEQLISALIDRNGKQSIAFDCTHFGPFHNGTFRAGKNIIFAAADSWPEHYRILVVINSKAWSFHKFRDSPFLERVDPDDYDPRVAAMIRIGQPFDMSSLSTPMKRAPVAAFFMLDTIAADCGYLRKDLDEALWHFVCQWADIIFTNSRFTAEQVARRYRLGIDTALVPSLHSVDVDEYRHHLSVVPSPSSSGFLIIGNHYHHKYVAPTVTMLAAGLPQMVFVALGLDHHPSPRVRCVPAGQLRESEIAAFYEGCQAVIFPSHYEGFGFPVMEALAHGKPIYARKLPCFLEIAQRIRKGSGRIIWYETNDELVKKISAGAHTRAGEDDPVGELGGWKRSALEILVEIQRKLNTVNQDRIIARLRALDMFVDAKVPAPLAVVEPHKVVAKNIAGVMERKLSRILEDPTRYRAARVLWRSIASFRRTAGLP